MYPSLLFFIYIIEIYIFLVYKRFWLTYALHGHGANHVNLLCVLVQEIYDPVGNRIPSKSNFAFSYVYRSTNYDAIFDTRGIYFP